MNSFEFVDLHNRKELNFVFFALHTIYNPSLCRSIHVIAFVCTTGSFSSPSLIHFIRSTFCFRSVFFLLGWTTQIKFNQIFFYQRNFMLIVVDFLKCNINAPVRFESGSKKKNPFSVSCAHTQHLCSAILH